MNVYKTGQDVTNKWVEFGEVDSKDRVIHIEMSEKSWKARG